MTLFLITHEFLAQDAQPPGAGVYIMIFGAVVVIGFLMISTHRRIRASQRSSGSYVREQYAELSQATNNARNVQQVMFELDDLARQIHGKLDIRFAKLETIIRDADQRINQLSRLLREAKGEPTIDVTLEAVHLHEFSENSNPPNSSGNNRTQPPHPHADIWRLADAGMTETQIAKEIDKPIGEVQLVLSLRRAQQANANST